MRAVILLFVLSLLPPLRVAGAQERNSPPLAAALPAPAALPAHADVLDPFALSQMARAGRDRSKGALYGLAIGALVGGVGLAAVNYAFTKSIPRDEYTRLLLFQGAIAGGAVGAVVGAIIGVPERDEGRSEQVRLHFIPELSRRGTVVVSLPLPSP